MNCCDYVKLIVCLGFSCCDPYRKNEHVCLSLFTVLGFSWLFFCLQFKPQEITDIMKDFDEPGHLAPTGLHLGGTKYMVIQGEAGAVIRGKKVIIYNHIHIYIYTQISSCNEFFGHCQMANSFRPNDALYKELDVG